MAQQAADTPMPDTSKPATVEPMPSKMHSGRATPMKKQTMGMSGRPCFVQAMQFNRSLQQKTMGVGLAEASRVYDKATQLRNAAIQQCQAGNVKAGQAQIQQAIEALQTHP